jgi:hypothetical protein
MLGCALSASIRTTSLKVLPVAIAVGRIWYSDMFSGRPVQVVVVQYVSTMRPDSKLPR